MTRSVLVVASLLAAAGFSGGPLGAPARPGSHHHQIATANAEAQMFFDQGLTLVYGFNHGGAIRMFRRAAELDPAAPMPISDTFVIIVGAGRASRLQTRLARQNIMPGVVAILMAMICAQLPAATVPSPPEPSQPDAPQYRLPVSLARVRDGLERPQGLRLDIPDREPDFRVDIYQRKIVEDLLNRLDFSSGPVPPGGLYAYEQRQRIGPPLAQPLVMVDLMAIGHAFQSAIASARRSAAERAAREEVQRALAEFCAVHECRERD